MKRKELKNGIDFYTVDRLIREFYFSPTSMTEWFGLSRHELLGLLVRRDPSYRGTWVGKDISSDEIRLLSKIIETKQLSCNGNSLTYLCLNNRKDDFVVIFVYSDEIKCYFLNNLPDSLQSAIIAGDLPKFTPDELNGGSGGRIVSVLKEEYFVPSNLVKFCDNANARAMSPEDYSLYMSGYPLGATENTTDQQIIDYLEKNLHNDEVLIPLGTDGLLVRSFAAKHGYNLRDLVELYGYQLSSELAEPTTETEKRHAKELKAFLVHDNVIYLPTASPTYRNLVNYIQGSGYTINEYIESLGFVRTLNRPTKAMDPEENDMKEYDSDGNFFERVYAKYPLLGSKIIDKASLDTLEANAKKILDAAQISPYKKITDLAKMQLTLSVINHAKDWDYESNPKFWSFITLQYGYRDSNGKVARLLQKTIEDTLKKHGRLFIEDSSGRYFKSTVLVHAFSTKKSWMRVLDFLFDFYKENLNWNLIEGDPLLDVMVSALSQKLAGKIEETVNLTISTRVYSFQEGIRKLVLNRPVYTRNLFERLIKKISLLINGESVPAQTYEELLCEEWYKLLLSQVSTAKMDAEQQKSKRSDVVLDYAKIQVRFILEDESCLRLSLPDIRLRNEDDVCQAYVLTYYGETIVDRRPLGWYGNELGKTLIGETWDLPELTGENAWIDIRVKVFCNDNEIYDSADRLHHRALFFSGKNEISSAKLAEGYYTIVLPRGAEYNINNAEITEIEPFRPEGLKGAFIHLLDGYSVSIGEHLLSFDHKDVSGAKIVFSGFLSQIQATKDDQNYLIASRDAACNVIFPSEAASRSYVLMINGQQIDLTRLEKRLSEHDAVFAFPLSGLGRACRIQLLDLSEEKPIYDGSFLLISRFSYHFNRSWYFSGSDFEQAHLDLVLDETAEQLGFSSDDEEVDYHLEDWTIHFPIPRISLSELPEAIPIGEDRALFIEQFSLKSTFNVCAPPNLTISFGVGEKTINCNNSGVVNIGSFLFSCQNSTPQDDSTLCMNVANGSADQSYPLYHIFFRERFLNSPEFWYSENKIIWNHGGSWIGRTGREFKLTVFHEDVHLQFQLDETVDFVDIPDSVEDGPYHYQVFLLSSDLFKPKEELIAEGDLTIGDVNAFRFKHSEIVLEHITDSSFEDRGSIDIWPCRIKDLQFLGVQDTSEGVCPVYQGVLYTVGHYGNEHIFSFKARSNQDGPELMAVNPVRVVYISDNVLCITDMEGDGLYYWQSYDGYVCKYVYQITDRNYDFRSKSKYSVADLYFYRTEEDQPC